MKDDFSDLIGALDDSLDFDAVADTVDAIEAHRPTTKPKRKTPKEAAGLAGAALTVRTRRNRDTCLDLRKIKAAASQIGRLPDEGEAIHMLLGGDFNGFDLIPAMLDLAGAPFESLYITTLGFNLANNGQLCDLIDAGRIRSATVFCSEYFARTDPDVFNEAAANLAKRGHRMKSARNHSKLILARTAKGVTPADNRDAYYVSESSANLRTCNNLEQLTLIRSREVYEFHAAWIEEVFRQ